MEPDSATGETKSELKKPTGPPLPLSPSQTIETLKSNATDVDLSPRLKAMEAALRLYPTRSSLWLLLLEHAQLDKSLPQSYIRSLFEKILALFPSSLRFWRLYIRYETECNPSASLEPIYGRALKSGGLVYYELWMDYISYCRSKYLSDQSAEPETLASNVTRLIKVFEGASVSCGADPCAGDFWRAYIGFLESAPISGSTGSTSYAEQSRMDAIRKTYQRLIALPHATLESLWRSYDAFENGLNKSTAKKILSEKSPSYMTARASWKEITDVVSPLTLQRTDWIDELPRCTASRSHSKKYYAYWKDLIDWEMKNMLHLEDSILNIRLKFAFQSSLANCPFYEDLWIRFANWTKIKEPQEYAAVLKSGLERLCYSSTLAFQLAEHFEESRELDLAKNVYETLIGKQLAHLENLSATMEMLEKKAEKEKEAKENDNDDDTMDEKEKEKEKSDSSEYHFLYSLQDYQTESMALHDHLSLVYIQYMHFCRRTDGLMAARAIFSRARKLAGLSWAAFVAASRMEYFAAGSSVTPSSSAHPAFKIFELGYKRFSREPIFLVEYMKLLLMTGDSSNARSLLERSISMLPPIPPPDLNELWSLLMDYEKENGTLSSLLSLSDRKEKYLNETHLETQGLVERTKYLTLTIASGPFLEKCKVECPSSENAQKKPSLLASKKKKSTSLDNGKAKKAHEGANRSESDLELEDWLGSLKRLIGSADEYSGPLLPVESLIARLLESDQLLQTRSGKPQSLRARLADNSSIPKAPLSSSANLPPKKKKVK